MENEDRIKETYSHLVEWLNEYSDDIPVEEVHSGSKNNKYKCRKGWWCFFRDEIEALRRINALPIGMEERFNVLWEDYLSTVEREEYGVKPEQIKEANDLLRAVISDLEIKLK